MAQYDGSIRISTEISTETARKSLGSLSNMITLTAKEISSLRSKMDALKEQKFYTDDYKKLQSDLAEAGKKLAEFNSLITDSTKLNAAGQKTVNENIKKYEGAIDSIKEKMQALENEGKAFTLGSNTAEYANYERQLQYEQAALEKATKQYQALNKLKDPYGRLRQSITDLSGRLSSILRPIQKIQSAFAQDVKVSGYEKLQSSLGELGGIAIRAAETVKNAFATLKQGPTAVIHGLSSSLMNMANTVNSAIGAVLSRGLEKFGEGIGVVLEKLRQLASGIGSEISSALDIAKEKLAGFAGSVINTILHPFQTLKNVVSTTLGGIASIIEGVLGSALEGLKNRAAGLAGTIINGIAHPFQTVKSIASGAISATSKLLSGMVTIAKKVGSAIKNMASMLKKAVSSMSLFGKSTKASNNALQAGFKNILKYGLGIRSLYALINKLRTAIKEGFSNMANEVEGFKAKVDSLKGSTLTLKNSFAAAFRPLVEVAIPYIQMVVDAMSQLLDKVGQFMAAIMGQKTYTKAIKQTTAALKDQNKAQNRQLSSLDKLNNLTSDKGSSTDSGAAGGMFEENVPISDKFADIAQWIKDMWERADFTELGALLGEKLKNALDSIDWEPIKKVSEKIGKSIGTLINGFVEVKGLGESIGRTIGEAINTGITGVNAFLDNTHWDSVGKFIGEALNGLVDTINWEDIGHFFAEKWNAIFETIGEVARTFDWIKLGQELASGINTAISDFDWKENGARLGDLVKGILDTLITLSEETNWQELGNNVADFIGAIDWTGIIQRLAEGIGAALGGLAAFLWGLIEDAWNSVVEWWNEVAFEDGEFTIKGLFNGILHVLVNIDNWIRDNIFLPIWEGIKKAFGIHSPSTVMAELGTYIIQGLLNGILSLVENVSEIWESMKEFAIEIWNSVQENLSGIWEDIKSSAGDKWNAIKESLSDVWNSMRSTVENVWDSISSKITGVIDTIKNKIDGFIGKVKDAIQSVKDFFSSGFERIGDAVSGVGAAIGGSFGRSSASTYSMRSTPSPYAANPAFTALSSAPIPHLATGAVIPANRKFLEVLGDQKHGTNIEALLDTIVDAMKIALQGSGFGAANQNGKIEIHLTANLDGREIFKSTQDYAMDYFNRTGRPAYPI